MMWLSALFGVTSVVGGLYLCVWLDSAGGGAIILFCTLQFLVIFLVAPKYGLFARWLRLRKLVPQQVVEDVLTTIYRHNEVTPSTILQQHVEQTKGLNKALKQMVQDELLNQSDDGYTLTEKGTQEAEKVLRVHRLWEAYLESIGTPKEKLHPTAHRLEHLQDTEEYLDEKLGRPTQDPHGKPIPSR